MIEVKNLVRKYGDFTAVDDVSFSIEKGEVVGLLGHNGGKTTIMKMLMDFLNPLWKCQCRRLRCSGALDSNSS